jgi:hypothetical protein
MAREKLRRSNEKRSIRNGTGSKANEHVRSLEEFRFKYLINDEKRRAARHMTPQEIGKEFAHESLDAAKQELSENPRPAA